MTTTLATPTRSTTTRCTLAETQRREFMLRIDGMEARVRGDVEKLMLLLPPADEYGECWFTRWRRAPDRTYSCKEAIRASEDEIRPFADALAGLAARENFVATITKRPYDGPHV